MKQIIKLYKYRMQKYLIGLFVGGGHFWIDIK